jgi:hypothetical protein
MDDLLAIGVASWSLCGDKTVAVLADPGPGAAHFDVDS